MFDEVKRLGKHSLIYGVGVWMTGAVSFIMVPVYTRCLNPSEYGILELLQRSLQIVLVVGTLGLQVTVVRFYYEHDDAEYRRRMIGSAMLALLGMAGFASVASLFVSSAIGRLMLGSAATAGLVRLMLLACAAEIALITPLALMQARTQSVAFTVARLSQFLLVIGLNIALVVFLRMGLPGVMRATFIGAALPAAVLVGMTLRREGLWFSKDVVLRMLRFGLPLVPAGLMGFVIAYSDRYFLNAYLDSRAVGIYSLGYKFGMLLSMIILEPFIRIWTPFQMSALKRSDARQIFGRVLTYVVGATVWCGLGIAVLSRDMLRVVATPAYFEAARVVPLIVLSYVFWGSSLVFDGGIYITKRTAYKPVLLGIAAAAALAFNVLLIPRWGMMGAAWSTLISYWLFALVTWAAANRLYPIPYEFGRTAKLLAVGAGLYGLSTLVAGSGWQAVAARTGIALSLPLALWIARFYAADELTQLRRLLRRRQLRPAAPLEPAPAELADAEVRETV